MRALINKHRACEWTHSAMEMTLFGGGPLAAGPFVAQITAMQRAGEGRER